MKKGIIRITAKKAVKTSLVVDIIDVLINGIAAFLTGSMVMLTEVFQGIADLTVDFFLLIGIKRSERSVDKKYPFGYGRELYVWALFCSLIIIVLLAGASIYFGLDQLAKQEKIEYIPIALIILFISMITNGYAFSVSGRRIGEGYFRYSFLNFRKSPLIETKIIFVSDGIGLLAALTGFAALAFYQITGYIFFDAIGAITIGIIMIAFGLVIFTNVKELLIGKSVSLKIMREIKEATLSVKGVEEILGLYAINMGAERILITIDIHAKDDLITDELERLIAEIKKQVKKAVPTAFYIQVELESPGFLP